MMSSQNLIDLGAVYQLNSFTLVAGQKSQEADPLLGDAEESI
jgi:hypothetical protein